MEAHGREEGGVTSDLHCINRKSFRSIFRLRSCFGRSDAYAHAPSSMSTSAYAIPPSVETNMWLRPVHSPGSCNLRARSTPCGVISSSSFVGVATLELGRGSGAGYTRWCRSCSVGSTRESVLWSAVQVIL